MNKKEFEETLDWIITFSAIGVFILFLIDTFADLSYTGRVIIQFENMLLLLIFMFEIAYKAFHARNKKEYLTKHWLDVILVLPVLEILRIGRLAKLSRTTKLARLARTSRASRVAQLSKIVKNSGITKSVRATKTTSLLRLPGISNILNTLKKAPLTDKLSKTYSGIRMLKREKKVLLKK